jgi:ribosome maturation factor RimP
VNRAGNLIERVEALIGPAVAAMGFDLVRVRWIAGGRPRLQVMAERPDGTMSVEDCAEVSHAVSAVLDVEDPIDSEYTLEVSSPGIDRPLMRARDYERFAGFEAKLETAEPIDGRKRFRGRLQGLDGEAVGVEVEGLGVVRIPLGAIAEAKLVLTDELVRASLKQGAGGVPSDDPAALRQR